MICSLHNRVFINTQGKKLGSRGWNVLKRQRVFGKNKGLRTNTTKWWVERTITNTHLFSINHTSFIYSQPRNIHAKYVTRCFTTTPFTYYNDYKDNDKETQKPFLVEYGEDTKHKYFIEPNAPNGVRIEQSFLSTKKDYKSTIRWLLRPIGAMEKGLIPFFLPAGYPASVADTYIHFYKWEFIKNVVSSTSYMISTQAMLSCIGLASAPTAGAINWVLKDGLGCIGVILVARGLGNRFDKETKRLRWGADCLHVVGVGIELSTMLAPTFFLPMASIANTLKGMAGITNGATKASINKVLALKNNLGDLTAKAHAQGLLGYLSGMAIGVGLFNVIDGSFVPMLASYLTLASVHLIASYRALRAVNLPTLNKQRLCLLLDHYFDVGGSISPSEVQCKERIIIPPRYGDMEIVLGSSLSEASLYEANNLTTFVSLFKGHDYLITVQGKKINVVLRKDIEQSSLLCPFFNAYYLQHLFKHCNKDIRKEEYTWTMIKESKEYTLNNFVNFKENMLNNGWKENVLLVSKPIRVEW